MAPFLHRRRGSAESQSDSSRGWRRRKMLGSVLVGRACFSKRWHFLRGMDTFALIPYYCLQRSERGDDYSEAKIISEKAC